MHLFLQLNTKEDILKGTYYGKFTFTWCVEHKCVLAAFTQAPKMTFSNGYNKLTVGYFGLKLHKYILGTPETNITSCKKGAL